MPTSNYIKRNDFAKPYGAGFGQVPAIKIFQNPDLPTMETNINLWLLDNLTDPDNQYFINQILITHTTAPLAYYASVFYHKIFQE